MVSPRGNQRRSGNGRVEVVVTVTVILVLVILLLPAIQQSREAARRSMWKNSFKQVGLALHNTQDTYGSLPPGGTMDSHGRLIHGWPIYLGDFLGYSLNGVEFGVPWNEPPNNRLFKCSRWEFVNPSIPQLFDQNGYGLNHMAGNVYVLPLVMLPADFRESKVRWPPVGRDSPGRIRVEDITDGTSNTLLVGEVRANFKPWGHPANVRDVALGINRFPAGFGSVYAWNGAQFLMCDGSIRIINEQTEPRILQALSTPAGGETLPE